MTAKIIPLQPRLTAAPRCCLAHALLAVADQMRTELDAWAEAGHNPARVPGAIPDQAVAELLDIVGWLTERAQ